MTRWLSIAILVLVSACSSKNDLTGSVSQAYPLDFQTVTASFDGTTLIIAYLKGADTTSGYTMKVTADLSNMTVTANQAIDLTQPAETGGGPRGTFTQILSDGDIALPFSIGTLTLFEIPTPGKEISGHFAATFTDPSGRDLQGDFDVSKLTQLSR